MNKFNMQVIELNPLQYSNFKEFSQTKASEIIYREDGITILCKRNLDKTTFCTVLLNCTNSSILFNQWMRKRPYIEIKKGFIYE